MAGRTFVKFHLDVGIGDIVLDPTEMAQTRDWLGFAGLDAPSVPMIHSEQQFAEKLHAYTLPRQGPPNSRARDLVDLTLLVRSGTLDAARVAESLRRTFARRGTHKLPPSLEQPPENWSAPFAAMAAECSLDVSVADAYREIARYLGELSLTE